MLVEAVERALALLDAFTLETPRLALADLARNDSSRALSQHHPAPFGLAGTFRLSAARGGRAVPPGPRHAAPGHAVPGGLRPGVVADAASPAPPDQETAAFYVRDGEARICLLDAASSPLRAGGRGAAAGPRRQRPCAARGQGVVLSVSATARSASLACPVFTAGARFLGALGVVGPIGRFGIHRARPHDPAAGTGGGRSPHAGRPGAAQHPRHGRRRMILIGRPAGASSAPTSWPSSMSTAAPTGPVRPAAPGPEMAEPAQARLRGHGAAGQGATPGCKAGRSKVSAVVRTGGDPFLPPPPPMATRSWSGTSASRTCCWATGRRTGGGAVHLRLLRRDLWRGRGGL